MKWAINRKIENERAHHDPMDCNHAQAQNTQIPTGIPKVIGPAVPKKELQKDPPRTLTTCTTKVKGEVKGTLREARDPTITTIYSTTFR